MALYLLYLFFEMFRQRVFPINLDPDFLRLWSAILQGSIILVIAIVIYKRFITKGDPAIPDSSVPSLKEYVTRILNSENFLTALRTSLPKGEEDKRYGLDFVPYLLESIEKRRIEAKKSAQKFLAATIAAAAATCIVVLYFGHIIVNDYSAGLPKLLNETRVNLNEINRMMQKAVPALSEQENFSREVMPSLENLTVNRSLSVENREIALKVLNSIEGVKSGVATGKDLEHSLVEARNNLVIKGISDEQYKQAIDAAYRAVEDFMRSRNAAFVEMAVAIRSLNPQLDRLDQEIGKPENRTPELIKRLAVGIVVTTVLLAVLRFLVGLYRSRYERMVSAEQDEFLIKRFYVAFKSSIGDGEQRKAVLSNFLAGSAVVAQNDKKDSALASERQETEVIKEVLLALTKKL
jgi:hypothetical protein